MVAIGEEDAAVIKGAAGPIATPVAIATTSNQRVTVRNLMPAKSHSRDGLRSPVIVISNAESRRLHHALVRIECSYLAAEGT
jgi:flavin reductase (DIM6/NTAB) family NADH-FMN oxidoreductase RutF